MKLLLLSIVLTLACIPLAVLALWLAWFLIGTAGDIRAAREKRAEDQATIEAIRRSRG